MDQKNIYPSDFRETFSFLPLINFWEKESATNKLLSLSYDYIKGKLKNAPELYEPITDDSILEKHKELIDELLSISISPAIDKFEFFAAVRPDRLESFYESAKFKNLKLFENQINATCFNENCCLTPDGRISAYYAILLNNLYGLNIHYEYPIIFTSYGENGLERHYRIRIYSWFSTVKMLGDLKPLTEKDIRTLFDNLDNPAVLMDIVPPDNFKFDGFFFFNAVDITDQETISSLKFDLIEKESIISSNKCDDLQHKVRVLLKKPNIRLGVIAFPSGNKSMEHAVKMGNSILLDDKTGKDIINDAVLYQQLIEDNEIKIIFDIKDTENKNSMETALYERGVRNLLIAPLIYKDELIGIIEFGSETPGDLNKISSLKLKDIFPVFAVCIKSSLDDLNKSVQSVIKEKCTAIHPAVEWKFREAALSYLNKMRENVYEEMEDIIFENVYPFYGASDVKDSSSNRNAAIQYDLIENLRQALNIVQKASETAVMPILEELGYRINGNIRLLEKGMNSVDEAVIINFLKNEVESSFLYLQDIDVEINQLIHAYKNNIDPVYGFTCKKRKEFEDSISLLNEMISTELEIQQAKAQKIFPHYFEKYKTDGVEHNIYLGQSLSTDNKFNMMHLKSLRLWQLTTMCSIAQKCIALKKSLKIELDMTHLIFVNNTPLTIKFFYDEKKFDVAGSYDVRYEIIKKRLDKAEIKDTGERLVAPGKIAIVYTQEPEAEEYKQYINFLIQKNYINPKIENFELAGMQGVHGLRCIRITVTGQPVTEKTRVADISHSHYVVKSKN